MVVASVSFLRCSFFWVSLSLSQMQGSRISICQRFSHLPSFFFLPTLNFGTSVSLPFTTSTFIHHSLISSMLWKNLSTSVFCSMKSLGIWSFTVKPAFKCFKCSHYLAAFQLSFSAGAIASTSACLPEDRVLLLLYSCVARLLWPMELCKLHQLCLSLSNRHCHSVPL